jgi:hypothetical protein
VYLNPYYYINIYCGGRTVHIYTGSLTNDRNIYISKSLLLLWDIFARKPYYIYIFLLLLVYCLDQSGPYNTFICTFPSESVTHICHTCRILTDVYLPYPFPPYLMAFPFGALLQYTLHCISHSSCLLHLPFQALPWLLCHPLAGIHRRWPARNCTACMPRRAHPPLPRCAPQALPDWSAH